MGKGGEGGMGKEEIEEVMVEGRAGRVFHQIKIYDYTPDLQ